LKTGEVDFHKSCAKKIFTTQQEPFVCFVSSVFEKKHEKKLLREFVISSFFRSFEAPPPLWGGGSRGGINKVPLLHSKDTSIFYFK